MTKNIYSMEVECFCSIKDKFWEHRMFQFSSLCISLLRVPGLKEPWDSPMIRCLPTPKFRPKVS